MKPSPFQINHPSFSDVPERVLLIFLMIWDLTEDQNNLEMELLTALDAMIERIPLFELPDPNLVQLFDDDLGLNIELEVVEKKGSRLKLKPKQ